jgi:hypothetical protein
MSIAPVVCPLDEPFPEDLLNRVGGSRELMRSALESVEKVVGPKHRHVVPELCGRGPVSDPIEHPQTFGQPLGLVEHVSR